MENIKLEHLSKRALDLFEDASKVFSASPSKVIKEKTKLIPTSFIDEDKKISIVFAGQYSAGKSSILSILTGVDLETGQGVTTNQCRTLDWNGIQLIDTPGIHTQKRPDHDEITYRAMSEADLIVFVCTAEGFSKGLGVHFRKLLIEKGKGNEMMLVINKMEDSLYGNSHKGQEELFRHDILPVISPEYNVEDLYITYIDTYCYLDSLETEGEEKEFLLELSGYKDLINNINRFIEDKKILGKCTTSLYTLEQLLYEAQTEFKSEDFGVDGTLEFLNQQRKALVEAKDNIKSESYNIVRRHTQDVRNWGGEIANQLSSSDSQDYVNGILKEKYDETESVYGNSIKELESLINLQNEELQKFATKIENSEFGRTLKAEIERRISDIKLTESGESNLQKGAENVGQFGQWLSKMSMGNNVEAGWGVIFKLKTYSGSATHKAVLKIGHKLGHKFRPWEAVRITTKIGQFGKILGAAGALLSIFLQVREDKKEDKMEKELIAYRSDIRNTFNEAANVINLKFDEDTKSWVEENLMPQIDDIDKQIRELEELRNIHDKEFEAYVDLQERTKALIREVQDSI